MKDSTTGATAYPLCWPAGRERRPGHRRERSQFDTSMSVARDAMFHEVRLLGGKSMVLSTNVALRLDGLPYANARRPDDPAVAVYFVYKGQQMCFACDRWDRVEDNIQAVRKTIEALRGVARWGTGDMLAAAFTGFAALPPPAAGTKREWWDVLECRRDASPEVIRAQYRRLATQHHPDKGGDPARMAELNQARDAAAEIGRSHHAG